MEAKYIHGCPICGFVNGIKGVVKVWMKKEENNERD